MTFKIKNPNYFGEKLEETTTAVIGHDSSPDINMTTLSEKVNQLKFHLNDAINLGEIVILNNLLEKRMEELETRIEEMTSFLNCEDHEIFKDLILSLNKEKNTITNLLQKFKNIHR